jgi:hypothetical protein
MTRTSFFKKGDTVIVCSEDGAPFISEITEVETPICKCGSCSYVIGINGYDWRTCEEYLAFRVMQ